VRGVVTSAGGAPLVDAQVRVAAAMDRMMRGGMAADMAMMGDMQGRFGRGGASDPVPVRADGTYDAPLAAAAGTKFTVTVTAADRAPVTSDPVAVTDGQDVYEVNLVMPAGTDLQGRVVTKPGGAAVPGALVSVAFRGKGASGGAMTVINGGMVNPGQTVWAVADADGHFTVTHLAAGAYDVSARAEGYVAGHANVDLDAAPNVTVEIEPELTIEGVVMLPDGSPVAGANLSAVKDAPGGAAQEDGGVYYGGGGSWSMTGAGGKFRIAGLASGLYRLNVQADWQGALNIRNKKSDPIAAGARDVKVVVDVGAVIAGRVLDPKRQPVSGMMVYASPEPKDGKQPEGLQGRQATTKEDGTFSLSGLGDATYSVQLNLGWDGSQSNYKNVLLKGVAGGTKDLEIVLEEGLAITGTITGPDGKPLTGAALNCRSLAKDPNSWSGNRNATTDSAGAFTFGGLAAGDCQITLQEWGGGAAQQYVIEGGDKVAAGSQGVRLSASKGLTITGSVVDESGQPAKNARVTAQPKSGGRSRSARINDDGSFEITGVVPGSTYTLTAFAAGKAATTMEDVAPSAAVRIVVTKGLDASGHLLDDHGQPVKQATVYLQKEGSNQMSNSAQTGDDGQFTFSGLSSGTYEATVWIRSGSNKGMVKCGTLRAGDTAAELRMAATPAGTPNDAK
jgi:protocatechuate 3,4-dioxygenase beta subunit